MLESDWGFHVVPVQAPDEQGVLTPFASALDTRITVPVEKRTASEHALALCAAISAATGVKLTLPNALAFDHYYAANGYLLPRVLTVAERPYMLFEWGTAETTAREALVELIGGSATTMTWRLSCIPGADARDRTCYLNMLPMVIGDEKMVVSYDRCANCRPVPKQ